MGQTVSRSAQSLMGEAMNHETIQLDGRELDVAFDYYAGDPSVGVRHEYHIYGVFEDCVPIFWGGIEDDIIQGLEGVRNEIKI